MRRITIDSRTWNYKVGQSYVIIRGPEGERYNPTCAEVIGHNMPELVERGRHKITSDGMVKPGQVKAYIQMMKRYDLEKSITPPGPMVLIGSAAASVRLGPRFRDDLSDLDVVMTYDDFREFVTENNIEASTIAKDKFAGRWRGRWIEFEIAWPDTSASALLEKVRKDVKTASCVVEGIEVMVPSLDWLFTIKASHRFRKNDPHFKKTLHDYHYFKGNLGCEIVDKDWLAWREAETYTAKRPKLKVSKGEFFKDDNIEYVYDHDTLHQAVAIGDRPAYLEYIEDGEDVMCSRKKWEACSFETKMRGVIEEAYVLALERSQIPHAGKIAPSQSFDIALEKICSSITSGWFREFAYENYFKVLYQADFQGYLEAFHRGLENGTVKRIAKEEAS